MNRNNKNLTGAKKAKNDEFYTRLEDIEKELVCYREHFKGKDIIKRYSDTEDNGVKGYNGFLNIRP